MFGKFAQHSVSSESARICANYVILAPQRGGGDGPGDSGYWDTGKIHCFNSKMHFVSQNVLLNSAIWHFCCQPYIFHALWHSLKFNSFQCIYSFHIAYFQLTVGSARPSAVLVSRYPTMTDIPLRPNAPTHPNKIALRTVSTTSRPAIALETPPFTKCPMVMT